MTTVNGKNGKILDKLVRNIEHSVRENGPPFFSYIIGNNGTGKSRLLAKICEHYDEKEVTPVESILCISNTIRDRFVFTRGHRRIYLGTRGSSNAVFFTNSDRDIAKLLIQCNKPGKRTFFKLLDDTLNLGFYIQFPKSQKEQLTQSDLPKLVDQRKLKQTSFNHVFNTASRELLVSLVNKKIDASKLTIDHAATLGDFLDFNPDVKVSIKHGIQETPYTELSSGEQNRISLALKIIGNAEDSSLILIDEPEVSLHLRWQLDFHGFISKLMSSFSNYHVIIATHSPIIVSEAVKDKNTDAVIVLPPIESKGESANIDEYTPVDSKQIDSCESLTLDYFDTATYNSTAVDFRIAEAVLEASDPQTSPAAGLESLKALLNKKGIYGEKKETILQAIKLIETHLGGRVA